MEFIKNIDLLKAKTKGFSISELKKIVNLNYFVDLDDIENTAYLIIGFIIKSNGEGEKPLKVSIKFNNVSGLKIENAGQVINLTSFEIRDMKHDGWDNAQRFFVKDYEDDILELKCSSIEMVSVEDICC